VTYRVLHVIDTTGPGGAETVFLDLAAQLDPARWTSRATVTAPGWVHDQLVTRGVGFDLIPSSATTLDLGYLRGLVRMVRRHRIDLVQTHLLGSAVYGTVAARLGGARAVCTFHGVWDLEQAGRLLALKRWLVRRADRLVFVSRSVRDTFDAAGFGMSPDRAVVIYNGIAPAPSSAARDAVRHRLGLRNGQLLVGAIGNVRPAKGYDVLLEAAARVAAQVPDVRFVIAGDTAHPDYEGVCRRRAVLGLEGTVEFLGFRDDVEDLLSALDVLVSTSRSEGFSLSTVQAMAAGVPVVATRSGGPEEILEDGRTGVLVTNGSAEAVARGIERVYGDAGFAARLAAEGRVEVARRFSLRRMVLAYEDLYSAVLGDGSQTGASGPR
jgi:glycosyltransferase involved in cell wall biosynthesis